MRRRKDEAVNFEDDLSIRLKRRMEEDRVCAENNFAVFEALSKQVQNFQNSKAGDKPTYNNYAVRTGLEHRNGAKRDAEYADDLKKAIARSEALYRLLFSMTAAVSLLKAGGKTAAPSDKMFDAMIADYEASIDNARMALGLPKIERG